MTNLPTSISRFGKPSSKITEEMREAFFTVHDPADIVHKTRCELHDSISCGIRPMDYTLEEMAIRMSRPNDESLSHLLYVLGEFTEPIDLSIYDMKLLHDDPGIEMFTTQDSSSDDN